MRLLKLFLNSKLKILNLNMLSLNNIKPNKKRVKNTRRLGRGNASGAGTYSGKGQKGQRSRSGVSNLKRLGMKKMILQTPKKKGFKSDRPKNQIVKVEDINKNFNDKDVITPRVLVVKGLINTTKKPIKVLGKEKLEVKVTFDSKIKMNKTLEEQVKK